MVFHVQYGRADHLISARGDRIAQLTFNEGNRGAINNVAHDDLVFLNGASLEEGQGSSVCGVMTGRIRRVGDFLFRNYRVVLVRDGLLPYMRVEIYNGDLVGNFVNQGRGHVTVVIREHRCETGAQELHLGRLIRCELGVLLFERCLRGSEITLRRLGRLTRPFVPIRRNVGQFG